MQSQGVQSSLLIVKELDNLPNKYRSSLHKFDDRQKAEVIKYYLEPNSLASTSKKFQITLHSLTKLLKSKSVLRDRNSPDRGMMISLNLKRTLIEKPEIVEQRIKMHTGSKRSDEARKKMREAAWKRMSTEKDRFISKAENLFAEFLRKKLGLEVQQQYREGLKPFDFLVDNRVLVEFDGPHHYDPNYYLCRIGKVDFLKQQERDTKRQEIANDLGLKLIIVQQKQVTKKMELKGDQMHKFMSDLGYEAI